MPPTKVKARCPDCGDVELISDWITLRVCVNAQNLSTYEFNCPLCRADVHKDADPIVVRMLSGASCLNKPWKVPDEALEPHNGPAICRDDILDLHLALAAL